MSSKKTTYICDICGKEYQLEKVAEDCEKSHYKPVKIQSQEYDNKKPELPSDILVLTKNGNGEEKLIRFFREANKA